MYNGSWPQPYPVAYPPIGYPPVIPGYPAVPVAPYQAYYQPVPIDPTVHAINKNGKEDLAPEYNTRVVEMPISKKQTEPEPEEEDDDTGGYLKQAKSPKLLVQGNVESMNLPAPMVIAINSSDYFKGLFEMKSFAPVIHEIQRKVDNVEPWASNQTASCCMCLLMKLFRMRLTERQMESMLSNYESVYVRAVGLLYLRLCGDFKDLYSWFEPQFADDEEFQTARASKSMMKLGIFAKKLLTEQKHFTILLPRIPVLIQKSMNESIKEWNKENGVRNEGDDNYTKPRNRGHSPDPRLEELRREKNKDNNNDKDRPSSLSRDDRDKSRNDDRDNNNKDRNRDNDRNRDDRNRDNKERDRNRDDRNRDNNDRDNRNRDNNDRGSSFRDERGRNDNRRDNNNDRDNRKRDNNDQSRDNNKSRESDRGRDDRGRDRGRDERDRERYSRDNERDRGRDSSREKGSYRDDDHDDRRRRESNERDNTDASSSRKKQRSPSVEKESSFSSSSASASSSVPKKPRVDLQLLKDMYGSSSGNESYNANPTLGATEVVRIGFSK